MKIRILIADDHAVMREGLVTLLSLQKDFTVIGEASNGHQAVKMANDLRPDVVIMDLMMPVMNGAEATRLIKGPKVLILTSFPDSADIVEAIQNGATGAIMKTLTKEDLFDAIRRVAAGETVIASEIHSSLAEGNPADGLTSRQIEILESLTRGLTYEEIGRQFSITKSGVKFHVLSILRKLNVANRSEAVALALKKHLLKI